MDEGYLFKQKDVNYFFSIFRSNDERKIKNGLQSLFLKLESGKIIDRHSRPLFEQILLNFIKKSKSERIRLWSYKNSCFFKNDAISKAAKQKIRFETNPENIMWIVCLVSVNTASDKEFMSFLLKKVQILSYQHIQLACYLFGNRFKLKNNDLAKLCNSNDKLIIVWIQTIHAYKNLASRIHNEIVFTKEMMEDLTGHDDDDISKYAIGALWKSNEVEIENFKLDYTRHQNLKEKPKKWFYTSVWQDTTFISHNYDLIKDILNRFYLFGDKCNDKIREGLARGLLDYKYDENIVVYIIEWYMNETSETVRLLIIKYILKCSNYNRDFREVVEIEKHKGEENIKNVIKYFYFKSSEKEKTKMRIFLGSSKEALKDMERVALLVEKLGHEAIPWDSENVFIAGDTTLESLCDMTHKIDAAIFIFNGEDETWYRGDLQLSVRDNVILEYGIFIGSKGRKNVIFVCKNNPKIASDLLSVNYLKAEEGDIQLKRRLEVWINNLKK